MDAWSLPTTAEIGGEVYDIRSDYRAALDIMGILEDAELSDAERGAFSLRVFYPDLDRIPRQDLEEAARYMLEFLAGGELKAKPPKTKLVDWKRDFPLMAAPVNRVLGFECRSAEYLHWWTFLSAYCEIGECFFAQVVAVRKKKRTGKRLEKWEQDFYRANKDVIDLKTELTEEEKALLAQWG